MSRIGKFLVGSLGLAALGLGGLRLWDDRKFRKLEADLRRGVAVPSPDDTQLNELPAPARRYLRRAVPANRAFASSVELTGRFRMKLSEKPGPRTTLDVRELLSPPEGFVWTARFRMGPVPGRARDYYHHARGAVNVNILGLLPVVRSFGAGVVRSSRHRLAAESVWLPSALLPSNHVTWSPIDEKRARVQITIDGETVPITVTIGENGRLQEVTMRRYGDRGVDGWQLIPYGFSIEREASFDGYVIPTRLQGGWWYGTDRYDPGDGALIEIDSANFRH